MQVFPQSLGRFVAPEMLALSLIEMILTFVLTLILLTPATGHFDLSSIHPAVICSLTVGFIAFVVGLYRPQIFRQAGKLLMSTLVSALLSFPAVWIVSKVLGMSSYWPVGYDPFRPVKIVAIWSCGLLAIRLAFLLAARCNLFVHRAAFVSSEDGAEKTSVGRLNRDGFLEIAVMRPDRASASALQAQRIRTLILPCVGGDSIVPPIRNEYKRHGITVQNQAEFCEKYLRRVDIGQLTDEWFQQFTSHATNRATDLFTRSFDIVASLGLLAATLPIMLIVALLVRVDSSGPILYKQERVGLNGRLFTLLKFRSMRTNAEAAGPSWAQARDPRVTRVGSFMRKTRIDELPQLLNILRGEMSFIGPRPERPHFVEQLNEVIPFYERRSHVKPGLTGWAQVNYPYGASVEDARAKLSFDLYYVKNRSVLLDLLILLSTVRVILFQEGAR